MPDQDADKSHEPTAHRRQEAREQGQVARSQDLGSAALLLAGVSLLLWSGRSLAEFCANLLHRQLSDGAWVDFGSQDVVNMTYGLLAALGAALVPFLGAMFLVVVAVNLFQTGILFLPDKLAPDLKRLDPLAGLRRIFSMTNLVRLVLGLAKIGVVAAVAYASLSSERDRLLAAASMSVPQIAAWLPGLLLWTTLRIAVALLVLALLDYGFQWWKQEQDLRMTHQEIREEMKSLQGDPQVMARRKQVQRQLMASRLEQSVPKADVVITNPTELAVAIRYDPKEMAAPVVVAKGAGALAQRIRRLALENDIPIVEKKPLAQALYKEVDIGKPIPNQMFVAVAEVLAYVYKLKGKNMPS